MGGDGRSSARIDAKTRCNSNAGSVVRGDIVHSETEAGIRDGSVANGAVAPVLAWGVMVSYRPRKNATARCNQERLAVSQGEMEAHWTWIYLREYERPGHGIRCDSAPITDKVLSE